VIGVKATNWHEFDEFIQPQKGTEGIKKNQPQITQISGQEIATESTEGTKNIVTN